MYSYTQQVYKVSRAALQDLLSSIDGVVTWRDNLAQEPTVPLSWLLQLSIKASIYIFSNI
jgi:hypothetical protein